MNKIILIAIFISAFFIVSNAQSNHPSIDKLNVSYKPSSDVSSNLGNIQCVPNATITLKSNSNATKIYFKIVNLQTNATIYDINYLLNSNPVTNNGVTLFENSNGTIKISSGQSLTLKPYKYEIKTEDAQNNTTTIYSATK